MLPIYDSNGNRRTDFEAGDSSTQVKEVQGDNVLTLFSRITNISPWT